MVVLVAIIALAAVVFVLGWVAYGIGAILGLISLKTHPVGGRPRKRKVVGKDDYYYQHPTLSEYDARYQSRENKPPRGPQDV